MIVNTGHSSIFTPTPGGTCPRQRATQTVHNLISEIRSGLVVNPNFSRLTNLLHRLPVTREKIAIFCGATDNARCFQIRGRTEMAIAELNQILRQLTPQSNV